MILPRDRYELVCAFLHQIIAEDFRMVSPEDALEWDLPYDTLISIQGQLLKRYTQSELSAKLYGSDWTKKALRRYVEREDIANTPPSSSAVVLSMAASPSPSPSPSYSPYPSQRNLNFPPLFSEQFAGNQSYNQSNKSWHWSNTPSPQPPSSELVADLERLLSLCPYNLANVYLKSRFPNDSKMSIARFLSSPSEVIPEAMPRQNLFHLIGRDPVNAPDIQLTKEHVGKEYESMLEEMLRQRHMEFETEEDSRRKGRQKTPDILFTIPMAVRVPAHLQRSSSLAAQNLSSAGEARRIDQAETSSLTSSEDNYRIVNWIDSKAMFADREVFEEHLAQFRTYTNRFGRGMVIYWQGFCEDVLTHCALTMNDNIMICDTFPQDWLFPTGESADGRRPLFDEIVIPDPPDGPIDFLNQGV